MNIVYPEAGLALNCFLIFAIVSFCYDICVLL
jgi:hypothetical protein